MGNNVIELQPLTEAAGPAKTCPCCGASRIEGSTARAFNCNCEQKIYGSCEVCRYCKKHCRCTEQMKRYRAYAWQQYQNELTAIRRLFPENVNQKER